MASKTPTPSSAAFPYSTLDLIVETDNHQTIVVRLLRTWEVRDYKRNYVLMSVDLLLLDEKQRLRHQSLKVFATLAVAQNMRELSWLVLVDTPLAAYFSECLTLEDLDDMNIEIMRNTLYKAYLDDFYKFCQKLGGATSEIMSDFLAFEADRRAVNITINSIGTELTREDKMKLYSIFGLL